MVEYYSGPCANEIYAPYVYVGHCYGYGDEAVLHHRIGVASAPEWIGQPGFFFGSGMPLGQVATVDVC